MSKTVDLFIDGFEEKFGKYLQQAKSLDAWDGKTISYSDYFSIIHPGKKFSDWDLECEVSPENFDRMILEEIQKYIHDFPKFENICDFVGNDWFQFMAFLPKETKAPFIDIHILGVDDKLLNQYFNEILDLPESEKKTIDWIIITWFRKVKNKDKGAREFRDGWLEKCLPPEQYEEAKNNPTKFFKDYLSGRGYNKILDFLI